MDFNKASQIVESNGVINVLHHGKPVWIDSFIGQDTAIVNYIGSNKKSVVSLDELTEG